MEVRPEDFVDWDNPQWHWPAWKFGLLMEIMFDDLYPKFNTAPWGILNPGAFHHDVNDCATRASTIDELRALLNERHTSQRSKCRRIARRCHHLLQDRHPPIPTHVESPSEAPPIVEELPGTPSPDAEAAPQSPKPPPQPTVQMRDAATQTEPRVTKNKARAPARRTGAARRKPTAAASSSRPEDLPSAGRYSLLPRTTGGVVKARSPEPPASAARAKGSTLLSSAWEMLVVACISSGDGAGIVLLCSGHPHWLGRERDSLLVQLPHTARLVAGCILWGRRVYSDDFTRVGSSILLSSGARCALAARAPSSTHALEPLVGYDGKTASLSRRDRPGRPPADGGQQRFRQRAGIDQLGNQPTIVFMDGVFDLTATPAASTSTRVTPGLKVRRRWGCCSDARAALAHGVWV
ncbi:hypothetical protein MAPG_05170 [Magnaporthiopsis poae ATCC 64411]|uniref:Uncharacterized protein n=1 Tax=Magnaporthiopsis poae (strain ATCC 64411 / 73-15) TaxID=644358 RepID=A0A0C4DYP4_MAGP6|nr:hypothetical protein MAPG_05170 [Magnaporthiopsis poae ATCC 64411]